MERSAHFDRLFNARQAEEQQSLILSDVIFFFLCIHSTSFDPLILLDPNALIDDEE